MKIDSQDATTLSFSPDDKHFYYKSGKNLKKMNLKTQKIKFKANLNNFVSSHIVDAYGSDYWTSTENPYMLFWDQNKSFPVFVINIDKVVFSPNWKYIAVFDCKSSVLCWDIEKNKQTLDKSYEGWNLMFSPCSRYLAIIKKNIIYIIETENWKLARSIYGKFAIKKYYTFSYGATKMAYGYKKLLELIDTATSAKTNIYLNHQKVRGLSFSPCGRFLAFGSIESAGYIMELSSQRISHIYTGFEANLVSVLFSPSSKYISWTDSKNNIRIYEFFPNFFKNDYNCHYQIQSAKISLKGTYLLTWSIEKSVLWDLTTFKPKQIKELTDHCLNAEFVFSPLETYLARGCFEVICIYDIKRDIFIVHKLKKYWWNYFSFSENEDYIISLNGSTYEYFKLPSFEMIRKFTHYELILKSCKFSSCGKYLLYSNTKKLFIRNLDRNDIVWSRNINYSSSEFNFTPLLKHIAYFDSNGKMYTSIINMNTSESFQLRINGEILGCYCFYLDEKLLVGGYRRGVINIWDIKTKTVLQKLRSLLLRNINWIEAINDHILIREKYNIEIFKINQLCL